MRLHLFLDLNAVEGSRRGLTLIELLLVMGLMAVMLGLGVGAVTSIDLGTYGAGSLVRSSLRSAGNWSRSRQAPARVHIDPATGLVSAEGLAVVGTWHFESIPPKGAFGLDGQLVEADLIDDGFVGRALSFNNGVSGAAYEIPVQTDPAFDLRSGFQIQMALRPESSSTGRLMQLGEAVRVDITSRQGIRVQIATQRYDEDSGRAISAGAAVLDSPPGILGLNEWNRVLISYDRIQIEIHVEGVQVALIAEEGDVVPVKSQLILGGGGRPWAGSMDGLVISSVGATEEIFLPEGVRIMAEEPLDVVFTSDGSLDRSRHDQPVLIPLEYDDGRTDVIRVNLYGTVE